MEADLDPAGARLLDEYCWWYRVSGLEKEVCGSREPGFCFLARVSAHSRVVQSWQSWCLLILSHYLVRALSDQAVFPQVCLPSAELTALLLRAYP